MDSSNVDAARAISELAAIPLTDWHPGQVIRITSQVRVGGILALALAPIAALLTGTIIGLPVTFRALNAMPAPAWRQRTGARDELDWRHCV